MAIIEGIGDEVVYFFLALLVTVIIGVAWATTDYPQQWHLRTVYLLDGRRLQRLQNQMLTHHTESATITEGDENATSTTAVEETQPQEVEASTPNDLMDEARSLEEQEQADIVESMDNEMMTLRQRRITFLQSKNSGEESSMNNATLRQPPAETKQDPQTSNFVIKLKYLNDNLRTVEAEPNEPLGEFKQRIFTTELSENKVIKLIFNGNVLLEDGTTLQNYGMFNNCVVHCLIISPSLGNHNIHEELVDNINVGHNSQRERDWDLGNLLIATVSFSLGSAWYFRYQYPQLFTVTATIGLTAITGIFGIISAGVFLPAVQRMQNRRQQRQTPQTN